MTSKLIDETMTQSILDHFDTIRTTVTLPRSLVERGQQYVDAGQIPNRNALIVAALDYFLQELERQEIDRQFVEMANDVAYQELNVTESEAWADSDWEALMITERGSLETR